MLIPPRLLAVSGVVLAILVAFAISLFWGGTSDALPENGAGQQTGVRTPGGQSTSVEAGALAPSAETAKKPSPETTAPPTPSEKQKLFDAMQQKVQ